MFLKTAEIFHFRNYEKAFLEFASPISVFTGDNGQGKSSFLEALYCALRGRSFHPFVHSQFIQNSREKARICLGLEEEEGCSTLEASFASLESGLKKEILYCGKKVGPSFLVEKFPSLVFTEASMKCIRQGPDQRRAFVDDLLCFGEQRRVKEKFNRVLKQKSRLLKSIKKGLLTPNEAGKMLDALNLPFLQASFLLVQERIKILKNLFLTLESLKESFFKDPATRLDFSYSFLEERELKDKEDIFSLLEEDLKKWKEQEIHAGMLFSGPQKHDIRFLFNDEDSRTFCSKGEQRAFILSLLGSYIRKFPQTFLFLDDVLLELDEKIQNKFLQFLEKNNCQTFLTNCKVISFKTKKMSFFSVKNGTIKRYD